MTRQRDLFDQPAARGAVGGRQTDLEALIAERVEAIESVMAGGNWIAGPGGMLTSRDPDRGGIIDRRIVDGRWFAVSNRPGLDVPGDYATRDEALAALARAIA